MKHPNNQKLKKPWVHENNAKILLEITFNQGISTRGIAKKLELSPSTVSKRLNAMEKEGWIKSIRKWEERKRIPELTFKGLAVILLWTLQATKAEKLYEVLQKTRTKIDKKTSRLVEEGLGLFFKVLALKKKLWPELTYNLPELESSVQSLSDREKLKLLLGLQAVLWKVLTPHFVPTKENRAMLALTVCRIVFLYLSFRGVEEKTFLKKVLHPNVFKTCLKNVRRVKRFLKACLRKNEEVEKFLEKLIQIQRKRD